MDALIISPASAIAALPSVEARIQDRLRSYAEASAGAFATNTAKAIAADTKSFTAFAAGRGASPLPAEADLLIAFIDDCLGRGHKPATIARRVSSIAHLHRAAGLRGEADPTKVDAVRLRLRAVNRQCGVRQRQAQAIGEAEVGQIIATIGPKPNITAIRNLAMLLVARDGLLRRSELVGLDVADLEDLGDGTATALIKRSKVDQEGRGAIAFIGARALHWVRRWRAAAWVESGPLFRSLRGRRGKIGGRLHADDVARGFKALAQAAGLDPRPISGHSTRVGMAQDLAAAGADLPALMVAGRWASPVMPGRYCERVAAGRGAVAAYYQRSGAGLEPAA